MPFIETVTNGSTIYNQMHQFSPRFALFSKQNSWAVFLKTLIVNITRWVGYHQTHVSWLHSESEDTLPLCVSTLTFIRSLGLRSVGLRSLGLCRGLLYFCTGLRGASCGARTTCGEPMGVWEFPELLMDSFMILFVRLGVAILNSLPLYSGVCRVTSGWVLDNVGWSDVRYSESLPV